jgi:hypothetical protein
MVNIDFRSKYKGHTVLLIHGLLGGAHPALLQLYSVNCPPSSWMYPDRQDERQVCICESHNKDTPGRFCDRNDKTHTESVQKKFKFIINHLYTCDQSEYLINIICILPIHTDLYNPVCRLLRSFRLDKCHRSAGPVMAGTAQGDMIDSWSYWGSFQGNKTLLNIVIVTLIHMNMILKK